MNVRLFTAFFLSLFAMTMVVGMLNPVRSVDASGPGTADLHLVGYIWGGDRASGATSTQGVGFISFCGGQSTPLCPGAVDHQVIINNDTGEFQGHAWSGFGWLSFNRKETGAPPGLPFNESSTTFIAKIDPGAVDKKMEGWGRFLSGCDFVDSAADADSIPDHCASSGPGQNSGDWDGWVNFSSGVAGGTPYDGFVATTTGGAGQLIGYAWGSDSVGWLQASTSPNFLQAPQSPVLSLHTTLSGSPLTGKVPLTVTLTAAVFTNSSLPITYYFECDTGGHNTQTFTITTTTLSVDQQCRYGAARNYKPGVTVSQDGVFATSTFFSFLTNAGSAAVIEAKPGIVIEISPEDE